MSPLWPVFCAVFLAADSSGNNSTLDLEQIRASYLATVSAVHTLECKVRIDRTPHRPPATPNYYTGANLYLWRKGALRAIRLDYFVQSELPSTTNWVGYNGRTYSEWTKSPDSGPGSATLPYGNTTGERISHLYEEPTIDILTGENLVSGCLPLAILMTMGTPQLQWDECHGHQCVRIDFPRHIRMRQRPDQLCVETTVWLDPQEGHLPRRILSLDFHQGDEKPPSTYELQTLEFRTVAGEDGREQILPWKGHRNNWANLSTIEVLSARVNGRIPNEMFSPEFPELTKITETLPNQPRQTRVVGDARLREQLELEADLIYAKQHGATIPPSMETPATRAIPAPVGQFQLAPDASPAAAASATTWLRWGLLIMALLAFLVAFRIQRARFRTE